jgi:hypothetical protein
MKRKEREMIASQLILDQRLAELRQGGTPEYADQAGTGSPGSTASRISAALRSLFGSAPTSRPVRVAAH